MKLVYELCSCCDNALCLTECLHIVIYKAIVCKRDCHNSFFYNYKLHRDWIYCQVLVWECFRLYLYLIHNEWTSNLLKSYTSTSENEFSVFVLQLPSFFIKNHDYTMYSNDMEFINGLMNTKTRWICLFNLGIMVMHYYRNSHADQRLSRGLHSLIVSLPVWLLLCVLI